MERIGPALKTEIVTLRRNLTYILDDFWDQMFSLRELSNKVILLLTASSCDALNEVIFVLSDLFQLS